MDAIRGGLLQARRQAHACGTLRIALAVFAMVALLAVVLSGAAYAEEASSESESAPSDWAPSVTLDLVAQGSHSGVATATFANDLGVEMRGLRLAVALPEGLTAQGDASLQVDSLPAGESATLRVAFSDGAAPVLPSILPDTGDFGAGLAALLILAALFGACALRARARTRGARAVSRGALSLFVALALVGSSAPIAAFADESAMHGASRVELDPDDAALASPYGEGYMRIAGHPEIAEATASSGIELSGATHEVRAQVAVDSVARPERRAPSISVQAVNPYQLAAGADSARLLFAAPTDFAEEPDPSAFHVSVGERQLAVVSVERDASNPQLIWLWVEGSVPVVTEPSVAGVFVDPQAFRESASSGVGAVAVLPARAEVKHTATDEDSGYNAETGEFFLTISLGSAQLTERTAFRASNHPDAIFVSEGDPGDSEVRLRCTMPNKDPQQAMQEFSDLVTDGVQILDTNVRGEDGEPAVLLARDAHVAAGEDDDALSHVDTVLLAEASTVTAKKAAADSVRLTYAIQLWNASEGEAYLGDHPQAAVVPAGSEGEPTEYPLAIGEAATFEYVREVPLDERVVASASSEVDSEDPMTMGDILLMRGIDAATAEEGASLALDPELQELLAAELASAYRVALAPGAVLNDWGLPQDATSVEMIGMSRLQPTRLSAQGIPAAPNAFAESSGARASVLSAQGASDAASSGVQADFDTVEKLFSTLSNGHKALSGDITAIPATIKDLFGLLSGATPDSGIQGIASQLNGMEQRIDGVEQRVRNLQSQLSVVESKLSYPQSTAKELSSYTDAIMGSAKLLEGHLAFAEKLEKDSKLGDYLTDEKLSSTEGKEFRRFASVANKGTELSSHLTLLQTVTSFGDLLASDGRTGKESVVYEYAKYLESVYNWDFEAHIALVDYVTYLKYCYVVGYATSRAYLLTSIASLEASGRDVEGNLVANRDVAIGQYRYALNSLVRNAERVTATFESEGMRNLIAAPSKTAARCFVNGRTYDLTKDFTKRYYNGAVTNWTPASRKLSDVRVNHNSTFTEEDYRTMLRRLNNVKLLAGMTGITNVKAELEAGGTNLTLVANDPNWHDRKRTLTFGTPASFLVIRNKEAVWGHYSYVFRIPPFSPASGVEEPHSLSYTTRWDQRDIVEDTYVAYLFDYEYGVFMYDGIAATAERRDPGFFWPTTLKTYVSGWRGA